MAAVVKQPSGRLEIQEGDHLVVAAGKPVDRRKPRIRPVSARTFGPGLEVHPDIGGAIQPKVRESVHGPLMLSIGSANVSPLGGPYPLEVHPDRVERAERYRRLKRMHKGKGEIQRQPM